MDTRSTANHLRENLINLGSYMSTVNSYIENFNQYVKVNVNVLKPRGDLTDDIMVNLFKAYKVASHDYFLYINKYNEWLV